MKLIIVGIEWIHIVVKVVFNSEPFILILVKILIFDLFKVSLMFLV